MLAAPETASIVACLTLFGIEGVPAMRIADATDIVAGLHDIVFTMRLPTILL